MVPLSVHTLTAEDKVPRSHSCSPRATRHLAFYLMWCQQTFAQRSWVCEAETATCIGQTDPSRDGRAPGSMHTGAHTQQDLGASLKCQVSRVAHALAESPSVCAELQVGVAGVS